MNTSRNHGMASSLERAEATLQTLLKVLESIELQLATMETRLSSSRLSTTATPITGTGDVVVCITSAIAPSSPLPSAIQRLRGTGLRLPPLILVADAGEKADTVQDIIRTIKARRPTPKHVVIIREADLPTPYSDRCQVVIGTRYIKAEENLLKRIEEIAREVGAEAIRDKGEFGGGALAYSITRESFDDDLSTVEITLSDNLVENTDKLGRMLVSLSQI